MTKIFVDKRNLPMDFINR